MPNNVQRYIDWSAWNADTYQRIDFWLNKYDRGECVAISGNPPETEEPEEEITPLCPKISDVLFYKCSLVEVFFSKG